MWNSSCETVKRMKKNAHHLTQNIIQYWQYNFREKGQKLEDKLWVKVGEKVEEETKENIKSARER